jgi:uncharacterized RDD family membrane protein YckC
MNNEITSILETLATKLGTTSERLWNILLKQAPITAIADLIQYALITFVCVLWIRKVKIFTDKILDGDWDEDNWIWIITISAMLGVFVIVAFFTFPNTIYALVNPEYTTMA